MACRKPPRQSIGYNQVNKPARQESLSSEPGHRRNMARTGWRLGQHGCNRPAGEGSHKTRPSSDLLTRPAGSCAIGWIATHLDFAAAQPGLRTSDPKIACYGTGHSKRCPAAGLLLLCAEVAIAGWPMSSAIDLANWLGGRCEADAEGRVGDHPRPFARRRGRVDPEHDPGLMKEGTPMTPRTRRTRGTS